MIKPILHYDIMIKLWDAYISTSGYLEYIQVARELASKGVTVERAMLVWQAFDMIYEKSKNE